MSWSATWARAALAGCAALAAVASPAAAAHPLAVRTLVVRDLHDASPGSLRAAITAAINCHRHLGLVFGPGAGGSALLGVAVDRAGDAGVTLVARDITLNHDYIAGVTLLAHTRANWVISNYIGLGRFGHPLPNTGVPVRNLGRDNHILRNRV